MSFPLCPKCEKTRIRKLGASACSNCRKNSESREERRQYRHPVERMSERPLPPGGFDKHLKRLAALEAHYEAELKSRDLWGRTNENIKAKLAATNSKQESQ